MAMKLPVQILPRNRVLNIAVVDNVKRPKSISENPRTPKVSWVLPYGCKAKRGCIRMGDNYISTRCGSRGCLS